MTSAEKARAAAEAALEKSAQDLVVLDVSATVSFADVFLIVSGRTDRQVRAITDAIEAAMLERGERPLGIEGYEDGRWVLMDLADVIVHVFQEEVRTHFDLERLWSDAPALDLHIDELRTREVVR